MHVYDGEGEIYKVHKSVRWILRVVFIAISKTMRQLWGELDVDKLFFTELWPLFEKV